MIFLFIIDVITSAALHIVVSCGSWIVYKSANGVYYIYSKLKNKQSELSELSELSEPSEPVTPNYYFDKDYVVITREEYDRMKTTSSVR
jgi:hypothetical protein